MYYIIYFLFTSLPNEISYCYFTYDVTGTKYCIYLWLPKKV